MTILYISGPMASTKDMGLKSFSDAAARLRKAGYLVFSPHEMADYDSTDLSDEAREVAFRRNIPFLLRADGVCQLPNWDDSEGAIVENDIAHNCGIPAHPIKRWLTLYRAQ